MQAVLATSEMSVRQSVCSSVCQARGLWQNEKNNSARFYTTWKNVYPSFPTRRMVSGVDPLYLEFRAKLNPFKQNDDFQSIFARSASAVTPGENMFN